MGGDVKDWLRPSASSAAASAAPPRARRRSCPYPPAAESACRSCPPPDPNGPRGATARQRRASSCSRRSPLLPSVRKIVSMNGTVRSAPSSPPARPVRRSASWMDASETRLDSVATGDCPMEAPCAIRNQAMNQTTPNRSECGSAATSRSHPSRAAGSVVLAAGDPGVDRQLRGAPAVLGVLLPWRITRGTGISKIIDVSPCRGGPRLGQLEVSP